VGDGAVRAEGGAADAHGVAVKYAGLSVVVTYSRGEQEHEQQWDVWIGLPGSDPEVDRFGFVAGVGRTRDLAVADAVAALEATVERLQAPRGVVQERQER
jgi:hypothetical protein